MVDSLYTLEEISEHGSDCSAWNEINEVLYDEGEFRNYDIRGIWVSLSGSGNKATDLLNSFHPYDIMGFGGIVHVSASVFTGAVWCICFGDQN